MTENEKIIQRILTDTDLTQPGKVRALMAWVKGLKPEEKASHYLGMYEPPKGYVYFVPLMDGILTLRNNHQKLVAYYRDLGICCETAKEAEFVKAQMEARLKVLDMLKRLNDGWTPDWENKAQGKWEPVYDLIDNKINILWYNITQTLPSCFAASTMEIWLQIIKELGEDKVILAIWPKYENVCM